MRSSPYIMRLPGEKLWHLVGLINCTTRYHTHDQPSECRQVNMTKEHRIDNIRAHHQILLCSKCLEIRMDNPNGIACTLPS